jgi:hypothetical protein
MGSALQLGGEFENATDFFMVPNIVTFTNNFFCSTM